MLWKNSLLAKFIALILFAAMFVVLIGLLLVRYNAALAVVSGVILFWPLKLFVITIVNFLRQHLPGWIRSLLTFTSIIVIGAAFNFAFQQYLIKMEGPCGIIYQCKIMPPPISEHDVFVSVTNFDSGKFSF